MEAKRIYKCDQRPWICSNKHDVAGVEEGKEATPCPVCKESFGDFLIAYLTSRLTTLGLDAENGLNRMFFKAHCESKRQKRGKKSQKMKSFIFRQKVLFLYLNPFQR